MFEFFVIRMNDPPYNFYQFYNSGMAEHILSGRKKTHGLRKLSRFLCLKFLPNCSSFVSTDHFYSHVIITTSYIFDSLDIAMTFR